MGNAAAVCAEMEAYALAKWAQTEGVIREFADDAKRLMGEMAPGPDTGTLKDAIEADEHSLGVFNIEVTTHILPNVNPRTGYTADYYGYYWNVGHYNIFQRRSVPPMQFMENGSEQAYNELRGKLLAFWS